MTRGALYEEARHLGIRGRSTMSRPELEKAITSARRSRRPSGFLGRLRGAWMGVVGFVFGMRLHRPDSLSGGVSVRNIKSVLRTPGPLRAAILSLAALAAGVLGLVVAYGVVPNENASAGDKTLRLVTVTGEGGTTTLAVTKSKEGTTQLVPVRVLKTVTGPGGVTTTSIEIAGPAITQIRNNTLTQILQSTLTEQSTVTDVVTQTLPPETVTEHQTDTVVVVSTVIVVSTETVQLPPPPAP